MAVVVIYVAGAQDPEYQSAPASRVSSAIPSPAVRPLATTTVGWNEWVPVPPSGGAVMVAPALAASWPLRMISTVFRSDPLLLTVRLPSGEEHEFRLVPETMGEGIWISPLPITFGQLRRFLEDGTGPKVVAIRFGTRRMTRALVSSIALRWYEAAP